MWQKQKDSGIKKGSIWKPLLFVGFFLILAAIFKIIGIATHDILPQQGSKILDGGFILFITFAVLIFARWLIVDAPFSFLKHFTIIPLLKTLISLILYFITMVYLLHRFVGINLTPLLTTSAVLTGIIALSLQETLKNLFTGIWINTERIVAKGDWVNIAGKEGHIMDVTWRTTRLLTFSNDYIYLPNKILSEGPVENYTYPSPLHIVKIDINASYKDPPHKVRDILLEIASQNPHVLKDPCPEVHLTTFGDFSIQYKLRVGINNYGAILNIKSDLYYNIWYAFKRNSIEIPFPIRTLYHHKSEISHIVSDDIKTCLREIDFLKPLNETDIDNISSTARMEIYGEKEIIFKQGDKGDTCYFIKKGLVDIILKDENGIGICVATLCPGALLGEMSLLTGEDRRATAIVKEDCELVVIDSRGFSQVFKNSPDLMEKMSEIVAKRSLELEETKKKAATEKEDVEKNKTASKIILSKIKAFFKIGG